MLSFGDSRRIFLARQAVDMRKGCASLAALVENALGHDPYAGDIFVFVCRRKNRVKLIAWDRSGFWLAAKHLEQGMFAVPVVAAVAIADGTMPLSIYMRGTMRRGHEEGHWTTFNENGALLSEGDCREGEKIGVWTTYGGDGREVGRTDYSHP